MPEVLAPYTEFWSSLAWSMWGSNEAYGGKWYCHCQTFQEQQMKLGKMENHKCISWTKHSQTISTQKMFPEKCDPLDGLMGPIVK